MENTLCKNNSPVTLVIFGITGDLIKQKVLLGLYTLFLDGKFCRGCKIICFIRRNWKDIELRDYLEAIMKEGNYPEAENYKKFLDLFEVSIGDFMDEFGYIKLQQRVLDIEKELNQITKKIYYLAISPEHFKDSIKNIGKSSSDTFELKSFEQVSLIIEKPFGLNLDNAIDLDNLLSTYFKENQIFRVDHYLSKQSLRFLENFSIEKTFGEKYSLKNAKKINVKILEKIGVNGRISFYEKIGALRDVGQNHSLQMFATLLATQEPNTSLSHVQNRLEAISSLEVLNEKKLSENVKREQSKEYLEIDGVKRDSNTETYFNIKTTSRYFKDREFEVILEGGKYQKENLYSIEITYEESVLIIKLRPNEIIQLWTHGDSCNLIKEIQIPTSEKPFEYYNIFLEVCEGSSKYFVSQNEVIEQWKFVDPILKYWRKHPLHIVELKSSLAWKLLILGYVLILFLCLIVILEMTQ